MKRDFDLIRFILFAAEVHNPPLATTLRIPGWSQEQVKYHMWLLGDAGLIHSDLVRVRMTTRGQVFLDLARDQRIWDAAKARFEQARGVGRGARFEFFTDILRDLNEKQFDSSGSPL